MSMPDHFQYVCRTCLKSGSVLLSLFEQPPKSNTASGSRSCSIVDMLEGITSLKVSRNDGLPNRICVSCVSELNRAYSFRTKCEISDTTLKQHLKHQVLIRNDDIILQPTTIVKSVINPTGINNQYTIKYQHQEEKIHHVQPQQQSQHVLLTTSNEDEEEMAEESETNDYEEEQETIQKILLRCTNCKEFIEDDNFINHDKECLSKRDVKYEREEYPRKVIKCPYCPKDFVYAKYLEKHIQKYHDIDESNNSFPQEVKILNEETREQQESERMFVDLADYSDENQDVIEILQLDCGADSEKPPSYYLKWSKNEEKQFECSTCKKVFINKATLMNHIKVHETF